ncbi:MAG TPA: CoA transferase, partial [Dehalococcoidia bacterium]|nr:CoA transferase [Dehalococcoidia bacterium]
GRALALRLAEVCDLVIENFAPRVLPGLGLGWSDFAAVNPAIVMLSMSGFGASGPERDNVLYGNSQVALCGLGHASGFPGGPPENIGMAHGDPVAAYHAAFAALVALAAAQHDGLGQQIDMSQWETMLATSPEGVLALGHGGEEPPRQGNRDRFAAPHGYFHCRGDDRYLAVAIETEAQWRSLCAVMGEPAWSAAPTFATAAGRLAHVAELERRLGAWTEMEDAEDLLTRLRAAGVPAALVATIADLEGDEHLAARRFFETIAHPEAGLRRHVGVPFKLSQTPPRLYRAAPLFGGDSSYVLQSLLGLSAAEVRRLESAGALH